MKRVVVDCDGAIVPQIALDPEVPIRRSLNHRGQSANVNLQIQTPATVLLAGIDGRAGIWSGSPLTFMPQTRVSAGEVKPTYMGMVGGGISSYIFQLPIWSFGPKNQSLKPLAIP